MKARTFCSDKKKHVHFCQHQSYVTKYKFYIQRAITFNLDEINFVCDVFDYGHSLQFTNSIHNEIGH